MSVYKAISAVMSDLSKEGITKTRKNEQQGYMFRGIDDVYNALAPFMAKHGLCILPHVLDRTVSERESARGGTIFSVVVKVCFTFVCAEDASTHEVITYGEAMDSGDKATNKAMSAAYKYACMQAFCIPTEGDNDADSTTHEVKRTFTSTITRTTGAGDTLSEETKQKITALAQDMKDCLAEGETEDAVLHAENMDLNAEERVFLWTHFDSRQRAAMKKAHEVIRKRYLANETPTQA